MPLQKNNSSDLLQRPSCPNCGKPMWLARVMPYKDCHRRIFECPVCLYEDITVVNCGQTISFDNVDMPSPISADIDQRIGFRRQCSMLILFMVILGFTLAGMALGLTAMVKAAPRMAQQTQRERTLLDARMESSREIRQALAKPIPHPAPLPPVTTHVTRAFGPIVVAANRHSSQLTHVAGHGSANTEPVSLVAQSSAYSESDRHTIR